MILGIDPAIATLGWAIVEPRRCEVVELGVRIAKPDKRARRLRGINEERLDRLDAHATALIAICLRRRVTRIASEAISLPRAGGIDVHASAFLVWGMLIGLARALGLSRPRAVVPLAWQRAVVPDDEVRKRLGYPAVESALADFVDEGPASEQLAAIPPGQRNHALDAGGVGLFDALHPAQARIARRTA